jgi:hypothetical protein
MPKGSLSMVAKFYVNFGGKKKVIEKVTITQVKVIIHNGVATENRKISL